MWDKGTKRNPISNLFSHYISMKSFAKLQIKRIPAKKCSKLWNIRKISLSLPTLIYLVMANQWFEKNPTIHGGEVKVLM